jgi:tRNA pseudouridine38-40 synthase
MEISEVRNIRMVLRYDGTRFLGWQSQRGGNTVQDILEEKILLMTGESVRLIAAGRTDAGVHALHQVCHFHCRFDLAPGSLRRGLNSLLFPDIHVSRVEYAPPDFHARYGVKSKIYEYRLLNRPDPDPFLRSYTWHIPSPLNLKAMEQCLATLAGEHDFSSFMSSGSSVRDATRLLMKAEIQTAGDGLLLMSFQANGFLRHMVRNLVGTLVEVGRGRRDSEGFLEIFHAKDRRMAGVRAPAHGLFLKKVFYEGD